MAWCCWQVVQRRCACCCTPRRTPAAWPRPHAAALALCAQELETDGYIARKMERRLDKAIKYVLVSGKKALGDAGLDWQGDAIKVCW